MRNANIMARGMAATCAADIPADEPVNGDRFGRLLEHLPIALWAVDASSPYDHFNRLKANGVTDIASYLRDQPHALDHVLDTVTVSRGNRAAMQMLGELDGAAYPRPVRSMFAAAPDAAERVMIAHFNGCRTHVEELRITAADGRAVDVLLLVTFPQPPERMDVAFFVMLEITGRLAAEAQLRQLQSDLAHAARVSTLGELATSIAHEVRQPLAAIVMNGDTSLRWLAKETPNLPKVQRLIEKMIESASQATEVIGRVQGMASKQVPVWTQVSLNEVVDASLRFVRHDSVERQVSIRPNLRADLPRVSGDRIQLQQVLVNLLVNAMQAIDHAAAAAVREIVVTTRIAGPSHVELIVEDSGAGIAPEHLGHLFSGFFTTKADGMGIGLTICDTIIRAHDGEIIASNRAEGGARFRCRLPVAAMVQ